MSMDWFRVWNEMPNDPKWRTIARKSQQPIALVIAVYIHNAMFDFSGDQSLKLEV